MVPMPLFKSPLLKYNLHNINCTHIKGLVQWDLTNVHTVEPYQSRQIKNIFIIHKIPLYLFAVINPFSGPQTTTVCFLSIEINYVCSRISYKWNIQYRLFCAWLHQLSLSFWDSFMLLHVSMLFLSLLLKRSLWYGYTMICFSIHLLMNIWIISSFWLFWIKAVKKDICKSMDICFQFSWVNYLGEELLVSVRITL